MMDATNLQDYVGAGDDKTSFVEECWAQSQDLVNTYLGERLLAVQDAHQDVLDRAYLEVGSELFARRSAPSGIQAQYAEMGAVAPRLARDPMLGTYPLLARFVGGGFA